MNGGYFHNSNLNKDGDTTANRVCQKTAILPGDPLLIRKWNGTLISETGGGRKNFL